LEALVSASGLEITEAAAQIAHFGRPAVHALVTAPRESWPVAPLASVRGF
jgi:hypothetical protein